MSASPGPQLSGQGEQWRAALEHNKAVLASQEMEMKEYLRRQQVGQAQSWKRVESPY